MQKAVRGMAVAARAKAVVVMEVVMMVKVAQAAAAQLVVVVPAMHRVGTCSPCSRTKNYAQALRT